MVEKYFNCLLENISFKLLLIFIVFDIIFGILRAIKEKEINSTIGIDGMIRKVGMIISTIFLFSNFVKYSIAFPKPKGILISKHSFKNFLTRSTH